MKGPKLNSVSGIAANQNRKITNKFNLNTENNGLDDYSYNLHYSSCGGHYGVGTIEKCLSLVTSLYPAAVRGTMTNMQNNLDGKTLKLKYFSADRNTPVEVIRRHFLSENGKTEKNHGILIHGDPTEGVDRETTVVCHCRNHCGRNVEKSCEFGESHRKSSREEKKRSHDVLGNRAESDKYSKTHKLLAVPFEKYFFTQEGNCDAEKGIICDECYALKVELTDKVLHTLLNSNIEETVSNHSFKPYVLTPKHIYCLNQQSRRRKSDEEDSYMITPTVDASVGTSSTNIRDQLSDDLIEELKRRKLELPEPVGNKMEIMQKEDKNITDVNPQQDTLSEPSDNADDKLRLERNISPIPVDGMQTSDVPFDKENKGKPPPVQEIKFYEGNLNIFGVEGKKESPYLKITKTVTFEKEREGKSGEKALGIDSWMQTDVDYNDSEKESSLSYGSNKSSNKNTSSLVPALNEPFLETAKVCGECLKLLVGRYGSRRMVQGNFENTESGKLVGAKLDESASVEKRGQNVIGMELIKNDFVKFITELFLEAIPKEIYNRMMGGSERLDNEEYEVRVKSYDRGSTESCNLKTCKMRNSDVRQFKDVVNGESQGGTPKKECTCSDPLRDASGAQPKNPSPMIDERRSSQSSKSFETLKKEDGKTYDCQITLNGRKILVKVNKSVEDLLLSGNIHNILRVSPDEDLNSLNLKGKQNIPSRQETKNRDYGKGGNCTCSEEMRNDRRKQGKSQQSDMNKEKGFGTQRGSTSGGARRGDSFTAIEMGNYQKKANSDYMQSGRNTKPVVTSPPPYGSDGRKLRNHDKNVAFNNTKSLFWSNVEIFHKENEKNVLKVMKVNGNDCDPHNRKRNRAEYPYKAYSNRRQSCVEEKPKERQEPENWRQSDECFPLFWETQCLKYCDQILSENGARVEKTGNCPPKIRNGKAGNFVREVETRMMAASDFSRCNVLSTPRPLCIIKISDDDNCENTQYRDYTVANITSMKLNSNPFDMRTITCRKCIETLESCSKQTDADRVESKQPDDYRDVNICDYYWDGITGKPTGRSVYSEAIKGGNSTKSDTMLQTNEYCNVSPDTPTHMHRQRRNYCYLSDQCCTNEEPTWWNSVEKGFLNCETIFSGVSCHNLHGICFSVSRVTHQDTSNIPPAMDTTCKHRLSDAKDIGVSTSDKNMQEIKVETKTSFTQTTRECEKTERKTRLDKQRSYICFSVFRRGSKASMNKENAALTSQDRTKMVETPLATSAASCAMEDGKGVSAETIKSFENVEVLLKNEDLSISEYSLQVQEGEKVEKSVERKEFSFRKSWGWCWKRKGKVKKSSSTA